MLILLFVIQALSSSISFDATYNYTLKKQQYGQIMLNMFSLFKVDQDFSPGDYNLSLQLTRQGAKLNSFNLLLFNSTYDEFYICYIHMMLYDDYELCGCLARQLCQPCSNFDASRIQAFTKSALQNESVQQNISYRSNANSSICYIGCNQSNYSILNVIQYSIEGVRNSNVPLIIDNSDFPLQSGCNFKFSDCGRNSTINVTKKCNDSTSDQEFCQALKDSYCDNPLNSDELALGFQYNLTIIPNLENDSAELIIIVLLLIVLACISLFFCILGFRYKRVSKQWHELDSKSKIQ
ncbi:hypothetical protein pb186bvf_013533 [Paramecium bursaria]